MTIWGFGERKGGYGDYGFGGKSGHAHLALTRLNSQKSGQALRVTIFPICRISGFSWGNGPRIYGGTMLSWLLFFSPPFGAFKREKDSREPGMRAKMPVDMIFQFRTQNCPAARPWASDMTPDSRRKPMAMVRWMPIWLRLTHRGNQNPKHAQTQHARPDV